MNLREITQFDDNLLWVTYKNVILRGVICINCIQDKRGNQIFICIL